MPVLDSIARVATPNDKPEHDEVIRRTSLPTFAETYARYFNFVWSCSRQLGVSAAELDDVVQEIFIVIHARLHTVEQPESLRSWIYGIVRRTISTYHRASRARHASTLAYTSTSDFQYPPPPSPSDLAEQSDNIKLLWSLLAKLDAPKREVFILVELNEMTVPEVAAAIDVPQNTIYSRLRSARLELETALTRHRSNSGQRGQSCPT